MRLRRAVLGLVVSLFGAPAVAYGAPGYHFLAGAARLETTPPLAGTPAAAQANQQFAAGLAACPAGAYPSGGRFALQEPFADLNGDSQWDDGVGGKLADPYCDANANGHWDGIYADNGFGPATGVHDQIEVRAVALSDDRDTPVVYASVDQIGIFDYYTEQARAELLSRYGVHAELVVTADHNESSPDSIGLYGAGQTPAGVGIRSGIDEYYMDYLDDRIAQAAAIAVHSLRPARLYAIQVESRIPSGASGNHFPLLSGLSERISDQFPTSVALPHDDRVAAVDPKLGVLQARNAAGRPIFTAVNVAAHNQEMGNSGAELSADWPGALERYLDAHGAGVGVFLVGDNGSQEDPQTTPPVIRNGSENHTNQATQFIQAQATGERFARIAVRAASLAVRLQPGRVSLTRQQFCIPLENNGFVALAAAGVFGRRQAYICDGNGTPVSPAPAAAATQFRTFVSYADIGPDLQLIDNPGEAFPALMLGSPFGSEEESCNRPNPEVPTWHARALFRFQVGLADDLVGYLIPAWGFASGTPGLFSGDSCYQDQSGHRHKLESESVGPTGSNDVANRLAELLDREPDPSAHVIPGRFVLADGSYSRWPTGAVGIISPPRSSQSLNANAGLLVGAPRIAGFGRRSVRLHGVFMDYDGQPQGAPDITTRGMMLLDSRGCVRARYYLDVFQALDGSRHLGGRVLGRRRIPRRGCRFASLHGVAELQPGPARAAGLPVASSYP